ncbi:MAG: metallophosphoesterase [Thermoleophilia bacterium]|nr:metallophosphoesterase [Thermoleophilia bacterium]
MTTATTRPTPIRRYPSASRLDRLLDPLRSMVQRRSLRPLVVRHVDLRDRGLDLGVRLLLASDLHARDDWFPREHIAEVVDAINAVEGVDLVTLLGDFVGDDVEAIHWSAEEYARIDAPTVGVLGNHDHWCDAQLVERVLAETGGVTMLTNRALPLADVIGADRGGATWLAGIDSCWTFKRGNGEGADPAKALADVPPGADTIVLGHEPHLATLHEHVLHLAGHTHCGQVRLPLLGDWTARLHMPRYSEPFPCRLYEVPVEQATPPEPDARRTTRDERWVYTTAGVGYSTVDVRVFCPPELVVIDA